MPVRKMFTFRSPKESADGRSGQHTPAGPEQPAEPTPFEKAILKEMREMKGILGNMEGMEERLGTRISALDVRVEEGITKAFSEVGNLEKKVTQ